jgi:muramoyltetrapeptide carboxypeptidase
MQVLKYIQPGHLIAVVAPAGKVQSERIMPAIHWLENRGYRVWQGEHLFGSCFQYSGTDEERTSDLQSALDNPEVKAIISARGGYGTVRIVEKLSFDSFIKYPKWLVGFSDITILHNICNRLGTPSLHGAMVRVGVGSDGIPTPGFLAMIEMLEGKQTRYEMIPNPLNRVGQETATLVGGNLSLLYSLIGTPFDLETTGKILFIEEIGEYLYHTDRMMTSLRLAGKLEGLKGLVVGQFTDVKDNAEPFGKSVEEIIAGAVAGYDFPVCFGIQAGHGEPNLPMIFGNNWSLEVTGTGSVLRPVSNELN